MIVIGGGDTGMDCISNSHREDAASVVMLDVYAQLPDGDDPRAPWPLPPKRTASTYALEEGGKRRWGTEVTGFGGKEGAVSHVYARQVTGTSSRDLTPVPGSEFVLEADLVLLAIGFQHPEHEGLVSGLGLDLDRHGNMRTEQTYRTSVGRVYACGDARIGQSLVVTAIAEGRKCARIVNADLGGSPMDADRERLAVGAWSGEADRTLRHEAEAAGSVRPGEQFFTGPGHASALTTKFVTFSGAEVLRSVARRCATSARDTIKDFWGLRFDHRLGAGKLAPVGQGTAPPLP